ncbi:PREDICTED: uncharacterized protein LOC109350434 [Lupinus angustifolius]|uniref:uncharacterized protein LOC109350434 n=1 Tax=Lupinus angustifolius TaxID=3871 RepID=UPI00092FA182|nr:PREDICTED: uncharacterized protein LOC109350434 [Lupinus angustifolius]
MTTEYIPWQFLEGATHVKANIKEVDQDPPPLRKTFAQALGETCDISSSQLPQPCIKGDAVAIKIPEAEYLAGLQRCKLHLHGRIILSKGDTPLKFLDLKSKLSTMWNMIANWNMLSLGKGFYEFSFSTMEDMRKICSIGTWNLKPGILRLFLWTPDFNLNHQKQTHSQTWIRITGLPQEYWSPKIIFSIAGGIGTPLSLDGATSNRTFGHFSKVLVEIDLKIELPNQILVEREGFAFFVGIEYENLPEICTGCSSIGHLLAQCRRVTKKSVDESSKAKAKSQQVSKPNTEAAPSNKVKKAPMTIQRERGVNMDTLGNPVGNPASLHHSVGNNSDKEHEDLQVVDSDDSQDNVIVQETANLGNNIASSDMRLLGRLWADDNVSHDEEEEFTPVLTKSQRKKQKKSVLVDNKVLFFCVVYASINYLFRRTLWSEIHQVISNYPGPWCCIGDFNVVLGAHECISLRLRVASDHFPLLFSSNNQVQTRKSSFKFHKMWLLNSDCRRVIAEAWNAQVVGCPMYVLSTKLKNLKKELIIWNQNVFGNVHQRVLAAKANVVTIQNCINDHGPENSLVVEEALAQSELMDALIVEESFWMEKAKINWHTMGDRNTSFFHKVTKIRYGTKALSMIKDGENTLHNQVDIENHVLDFYTNLFASPNNTSSNSLIHDVIPCLVVDDDNSMLTNLPSQTEIKAVVFALPLMGWLLKNLNSNSVILVQKVNGADKIEDYRPIALANFQFKIITKILADRLATIAPKIISKQQRGFIKDRQIKDCICLASEAINMLDHKVFGSNLAIKLDIKKAFDTLDWNFLLDTLHAFGFNHKFIHWIKIILHSAKLSIIVNGNSVGFFNCTREVRQGDPLSPLLFCLAEDVLSRGILKLVNDKKLSTIAGPNRMHSPSHVLYVDDILIFCKGAKKELLCLKQLVLDYPQVSGQQINTQKCRFYVINASARTTQSISSLLGFVRGSLPFTYVGVHLFQGKPKRCHLQPNADRILAKLATWKGSSLSIMGRVELVRSIIHSMLIYSFYVYKWPASLIDCLDKGIRNFIWSGDIGTRKLVTVAWSKVCVPISQGGLGLRSTKMLNKAALLHLAWNMRCDTQAWAEFCRKRFGNLKETPNRHFKSSIWHGIKENWCITSSNSIWLIGNGENVNF